GQSCSAAAELAHTVAAPASVGLVDLRDDLVGDLAALVADVITARVDVDDYVVGTAQGALALPAVSALLRVHHRNLRRGTLNLRERPPIRFVLVGDRYRLAGTAFPLVRLGLHERFGFIGGGEEHHGLVDPVVVVVSGLGGHQAADPGEAGTRIHRVLGGVKRALAVRRRQRHRRLVHRQDGLAGLHRRRTHDRVDVRRVQQQRAEALGRNGIRWRRRRRRPGDQPDSDPADDEHNHHGDCGDDRPRVALARWLRLSPRRGTAGLLRWGCAARRLPAPAAGAAEILWGRCGVTRAGNLLAGRGNRTAGRVPATGLGGLRNRTRTVLTRIRCRRTPDSSRRG